MKSMIYLLQCGETEWSSEGRIQGQQNSPLTTGGRQQALALGMRLIDLIEGGPSFRCLSSPLGRSRETAILICSVLGIDLADLETDERLKECCYGDWEGKTMQEVAAHSSENPSDHVISLLDMAAPGGESYASVVGRVTTWLKDVEGADVIAVSHGCVGRVIRGVYTNLRRAQTMALRQDPDEIHVLADRAIVTYQS